MAGQDSSIAVRNSLPTRVWQDVRLSLTDAGALAASPLHWDGRSMLIAAGTAGAFCGSLALDNRVRNFEQSHQSAAGDHLIRPWQYYGQDLIPIGGAGALYLAGLGFSNPWLQETGRRTITALALASLITTSGKMIVGRARPFTGLGPHYMGWFKTADSLWSFPSGHVTAAFALSSVLASRIDNPYASILLYGAATMTAAARLYDDQHWLSDAVAGAVIGTVVGHFIGCRDEGNQHAGAVRFGIEPVVMEGAVGLGLTGKIRG